MVTRLIKILEHYRNTGIPVKNTEIPLILLILIYYIVKEIQRQKGPKHFFFLNKFIIIRKLLCRQYIMKYVFRFMCICMNTFVQNHCKSPKFRLSLRLFRVDKHYDEKINYISVFFSFKKMHHRKNKQKFIRLNIFQFAFSEHYLFIYIISLVNFARSVEAFSDNTRFFAKC